MSRSQDTACTTAPMVTQVTNFDPTPNEEGDEILVTWQTVVEVDTEGFNLYRTTDAEALRDATQGYEKINDELILSQAGANGQGHVYQSPEQDIEPNMSYDYLLEEVKNNGESRLHEEEIEPNEVEIENRSFPYVSNQGFNPSIKAKIR